MRTGLFAFGVILLVIGVFFYFVPTPTASAQTTTVNPGSTDTQVSSATVTIPWGLTVGVLVLGFIFTILGIALPSVEVEVVANDTEKRVVDMKSSEVTTVNGKGKRHTVHKREVKHEHIH